MSENPFLEKDGTDEEIDREEEYVEWLRFARLDDESAKYLYNGSLFPKPLEIIYYHC